jgi:uncharacterized protein YjbI with pentapeptide repeats
VRVTNTTAFPFGARVTSTRPPEPEMVLVVRGRFAIVPGGEARALDGDLAPITQGPLTGYAWAEDDPERERAPIAANDFADVKPYAEAMLVGAAYAPGGRPVGSCDVGFAVGAWQKRLRVFGARAWEDGVLGARPGDPAPFTRLVLGYDRAFGGAGHAENPSGVGLDGLVLPCLERPDALVKGRGDRPAPASLGPTSPTWPARARKLGTKYGPSYAPRAPYYAEDVDFTYFQSAAPDQWIEAGLAGDELVVLENLHREHARLETRLPGLRVRAFVNDVAGAFREVRMRLDTVLVDAEAGTIDLTWRGRTTVVDAELEDVTTVLVAAEPLAERPKPIDAFRAELAAFEADPLGLGKILPKEEAALLSAKDEAARAEALAALLAREAGPEVGTAAAHAPGGDLAAALVKAANDDAPPPVPLASAPRATIGIGPGEIAAMREAAAKAGPEALRDLDAKLDAEELRDLDPTWRRPGGAPVGDDEPGPRANLEGRDLRGRDLAGADLEGANLRGANLTDAILRGARLAGADLEGALLFRADLEHADLAGARLARSNAAKANLVGARLDGANLEAAYLGKAIARGARFDDATGAHAFFTEADLEGASFEDAALPRADFEGARVEGARFAGAGLDRALFLKARAARASFDGASLDGASFDHADLEAASLAGARGAATNFLGARLASASLVGATFERAHFTHADAKLARFDAAILTGSRFFKADLAGASLRDAKLVSADLCKATLDRARFDGANLYDAKLLGAKGVGASFAGANLVRTVRSPS